MGERGMQLKSDLNKSGWEEADFPVACETCLGDNPYVRMTKEPAGKACKICERPFCNFRWKPGTNARYKSTQVCQTCAKMKNVCQVCILDLQYGLPVQVRDRVLAEGNEPDDDGIPKSDTNLQWMVQQQTQLQASGGSGYDAAGTNQKLLRMARNAPYYRRNMAHKCSFFAKGECTRGDRCPFQHVMPTDRSDPMAHQNVRDRFYGKDDPVANKILGKMADTPQLLPPADPAISTLWVGGLTPSIREQDLRDAMYAYGEIANVRVISPKGMAFVEYTTRAAAETAATALYRSLSIHGVPLRVSWAVRREGLDAPSGNAAASIDSFDTEAPVDRTYMLPPPPGLAPGAPLPQLPQIQAFAPPPPAGMQMPPAPRPPGPPHPAGVPLPPPGGPQRPQLGPPPGPPGGMYGYPGAPPQPMMQQSFAAPMPQGGRGRGPKVSYPSMDPNRMGATPKMVAAGGRGGGGGPGGRGGRGR